MSILDVQNAVLDTFQKDSVLDALLATVLTGTATSSGTSVTGVDTLFTTEAKVGDYIGNTTKGYRKITAIADDLHLTVKSAFDNALDADSVKKTEIKKGIPDDFNISTVGRFLRIGFVSSASTGDDLASTRVRVHYGFIMVMGFKELDADEAEDKKSIYEEALGNCIDQNPTFNLAKVEGTTEIGQMKFTTNPAVEGEYIGIAPLVITRQETRGSR